MADVEKLDFFYIWASDFSTSFDEKLLSSNSEPDDGEIYVMYHGTNLSAALSIIANGFRPSADGMLGRGVYVTRDKDKAARYPLEDKSDQVILKLKVNVGKVKKINYQGHPMQKTWHDHGYDTAWVPPYCDMVKSEEDCVWDPKRIRVIGAVGAPLGLLQPLESIISFYRKKHKNYLGSAFRCWINQLYILLEGVKKLVQSYHLMFNP